MKEVIERAIDTLTGADPLSLYRKDQAEIEQIEAQLEATTADGRRPVIRLATRDADDDGRRHRLCQPHHSGPCRIR